jgi:membrane protease YdiL (CAAX protease family)
MEPSQQAAKNNSFSRTWHHAKRWLVTSSPPFYSLGHILLLLCGLALIHALLRSIHQSMGMAVYKRYWYYDSPAAVLLVIAIVFWKNSRLLNLSRWRPRWIDTAAGIGAGAFIALFLWAALPSFASNLSEFHLPWSAFVPIVCAAPVMEEILFRGIVLQSFLSNLPLLAAVALTAVLAGSMHQSFWMVLPIQTILSLLYVAFRSSLPASIAAHVTNNLIFFLLAR